jgi:hypothetical protein
MRIGIPDHPPRPRRHAPTLKIVPFAAAICLILLGTIRAAYPRATLTSSLRFEISIARNLLPKPETGRLLVVLSRRGDAEPRFSIGRTGVASPPVFARDAKFDSGKPAVIDETCAAFPIASLAALPAGDYSAQAVFDTNTDLKSVNAPGNLYSAPQRVSVDPDHGGTINIELNKRVPPEELPAATEYVKYEKIQSDLLTRFHRRPIYLRAGIILPRDFQRDTTKRYPLRVQIGGYGSSFTNAGRMMASGSPFRSYWLSDECPRMILVHLDGDGPFGDCYQVNSDNNGPYGDALTKELIPFIEQKYRGIGSPRTRVLTGGSTGGWVSLALQVFYPDFFNGTWSGFPDGVDFRGFQLINIYQDENAYVNQYGFERPSARNLLGETMFTIRHECQMENTIGLGDSWTMSGEQWGAWNATYGPRGSDGRPVPLWDPKTGRIDRSVVDHWKKYDLRLVLEQNWRELGPKLKGKIHVWVGEADEYFLNNAVHLLDKFLSGADPAYDGWIRYGPGKGHGWMPVDERELMKEMSARIESEK